MLILPFLCISRFGLIFLFLICFFQLPDNFRETICIITRLIITIIISSNMLVHRLLHFSLIILYSCKRTVEAANHTRSTQLNPPITELITLTIATTTYPKKNKAISKMEEHLTKDIVSTGDICSRCICFFEN